MSRTQWCCLTAVLAVVLGLLGGATAGRAGAGAGAASPAPVAAAAVAGPAAVVVNAPGAGAAVDASAAGPAVASVAAVDVPVAGPTGGADHEIPGCGPRGGHDGGEPAVPSRGRAAHDQAPGLAPWGLPAATGAPSAEPPPGIRVRFPVPATPTPVELSVLRV
ncbi:hypothetical protein ACIP6P_09620 [Streptomyces sp. NPDC088729]|uniref:hypothetical protein n=1 Tax=Streptomyces sp. NPDC088729 TaxID=3365876 RepID=UPI0038190D2E